MTEPDESSTQPRDAGVSGFYRSAADDAPSAAVDAAILKAARDAVAPAIAPVRPWWKRLIVPAGVAATALFAVMLSLTMARHPADLAETLPQQAAPSPAAVPPTPASPVPTLKGSADQPALAKEAPAIMPPPRAAAPAEKKAKAEQASPPMRDVQAPQAAPAAPVSLENRMAAPAARVESQGAGEGVPAERARAASAPAPLSEAAAKRMPPRSEIVWLEEIRQLRRQGRHEEASRRLAEFRLAYPDYVLPDDLK